MKQEAAIGIDIGGTNTQVATVDMNGNILTEKTIKTCGTKTFDDFTRVLIQEIKNIQKHTTLVGVGIGAPAANHFTGTIEAPVNINWEGSLPIKHCLEKELSCPIVIDNDANAAAVGEYIYGAGKNIQHQITITLGTGVGSGIIINGELVYGASGFAGELGHISIRSAGRRCGCGKVGCFETYLSAHGIKQTLEELLEDSNVTSVFSGSDLTTIEVKDIFLAAQKGDTTAIDTFTKTGEILGETLANFAAFTAPELFVLFGGITQAGDLLLLPAQKAFNTHLLFLYKDKTRLVLSQLMNSNAAILGSAALAWKAHITQ